MKQPPVDRVRVLVVDDEPQMLELYAEFLQLCPADEGGGDALAALSVALFGEAEDGPPQGEPADPGLVFEVTACRQGREALEAVEAACAEQRPFAAAFLDVRMPPGPDGVWTAEQIRRVDPRVNIVIVTGFSDIAPDEIARRVPPAHRLLYLQKPVHCSETRQVACSLGAKWRAEQALEEANRVLEAKVAERVQELTAANAQLRVEIEERTRAEAALRESEARYRSFLKGFQGIAFRVQADWTPVFYHGAVEVLTGFGEEDFLSGRVQLSDLVLAEDRARFETVMEQIREGEAGEGVEEFRVRRRDGTVRWMQAWVTRAPGRADAPPLIEGVLHDITLRKEMQERMEQTRHLAALGELSAQVAHEIKNPLAAISGAVQVIRGRLPKDDEQGAIMDEVVAYVERVDATVRSLLSFARPWRPEKQDVDLRALMARLWQGVRGRKDFAGVELVLQGPDALVVAADPALAEQVLWNVLDNARQAMDGEGRIVCVLREDDVSGTAAVIDEGPGISPEMAERLFRPFVTTKTRGTGLGLAISRRIMEAHGGSITLANEPGKGARAEVTFPKGW